MENNLKKFRKDMNIKVSSLAKKSKVSKETIHRIEKGGNCQQFTKRKLTLALFKDIEKKNILFPT